jgi:hypothetical protein
LLIPDAFGSVTNWHGGYGAAGRVAVLRESTFTIDIALPTLTLFRGEDAAA